MKKKVIILIKQILRQFGIQVIKIENTFPNHIENSVDISPIAMIYQLHKNGTVIYADVNKGRGLPINTYGNKGNHPFSFAVSIAKDFNKKEQYDKICDLLSTYYDSVKPLSAAEVAGLSTESILHDYPSWAIVMPWDTRNLEEWKEHIAKSVIMENLKEKSKADIRNGWAWIGPVDNEKLNIESKRLANLLASIQENGYKNHDENDGDIMANLLVNEDNKWVWQSIGAQHRASILSGLNWNSIPIRVNKIIRRQDVEFWPNVINNTFTINEALHIFDMIFNANFSHITKEWDDFTQQSKDIHG